MKCQGCGHDYPSTLTRCTRCGQLTSRRTQKPTQSRLIEFPRKARVATQPTAPETPIPAWRAELNERVRAIKAKRSGDAQPSSAIEELASQPSLDPVETPAIESRPRSRSIDRNDAAFASSRNPGAGQRIETVTETDQSLPVVTGARAPNPIVEAALTRVRRASENASRAALPKIEPAKTAPKSSIVVDREATARALEPAPEINPVSSLATSPLPKISQEPLPYYERKEEAPKQSFKAQSSLPQNSHALECEDSYRTLSDVAIEQSTVLVLDEIEPRDYLEDEIKKVDKALSEEFSRNESPSLFIHAIIAVTDLLAIALSCAPFLALMDLFKGSFNDQRTQLAAGTIIFIISFFYLALTQTLGARTFGMMLTNTRLVDAQTFQPPSAQRMLLRTVGYYMALAPFMIGLLWVVTNRKRRAWQDIISGTLVARDF